jgi:hypothetical protein
LNLGIKLANLRVNCATNLKYILLVSRLELIFMLSNC